MEVIHARRPRFRRERPPKIGRITERDIAILQAVDRNRFLRSTHVIALFATRPSNAKRILHRLHVLYHNGYLDRPVTQIDYQRYGGGSAPMTYGLGRNGARLLDKCLGPLKGRLDRASKTRAAARMYLDHALAVSDFMVMLECACNANTRQPLMEKITLSRSLCLSPTSRRIPERWQVSIPWFGAGHKLHVIPDGIFSLLVEMSPNIVDQKNFVVEIDRATMPVFRNSLERTSLFRKLMSYAYTYADGTHKARWEISNFRVLMVTTTEERIRNAVFIYRRYLSSVCPPGVFLFSTKSSLSGGRGPFSVPWIDGKGQEVRIP